jgi:phage shock protein A
MGVFTRFRDIVNSNFNAMLDRAEDPEKLINLMIREMEDTLVEIKASCANVIAGAKKIERQIEESETRAKLWENRAGLAITKGRDDLAREALMEKRRYGERFDALQHELEEHRSLVDQYQQDIRQLEDKLRGAKEKRRMLVQRHVHAVRKKHAQEEIRRMDNSKALLKFEELENRIDRMEAEAALVNFGKKPALESDLESLLIDEDIEKELRMLKTSVKKQE